MAHTENPDEQLLDNYLLQQMTAAEQAAFEQRLAREPTLLQEMESRKILIQGVRFSQRTAAREQAKQLRAKLKRSSNNHFSWSSLILIATLVGCIWLGYRVFFSDGNMPIPSVQPQQNEVEPDNIQPINDQPAEQAENHRLPDKEQKTDDNLRQLLTIAEVDRYVTSDFSASQQRNAPETTTKNTRQLGTEAFAAKAFLTAMQHFEDVTDLQEYPDDFAKLGFCYLKTGKTEKAIDVFEKISNPSYAVEWNSRGKWYLLLAYLDAGQSRNQDFQELLATMLKDETIDETVRQRVVELQSRLK